MNEERMTQTESFLIFRQARIPLVCPNCHGPLTATLLCNACGNEFSNTENIPRLIHSEAIDKISIDEKGDTENNFKNFFKRWPNLYQWAIRIVAPVIFTGLSASRFFDRTNETDLLLNVGSGPTDVHPRAINVDVFHFPNVHIIADAERMPFASDTFDAVCCEEVLEHIRRPENVVAEMKRVTKPGGNIYISVPFLFPYHPSPNDFRRYSLEGLRSLFSDFEVIESGVHSGPISATLIVLASGLATIASFGIHPIQKILNYLFMLILSPLKLLDLYYAKTPAAEITASGVYIVAKKPSTNV